MNDWEAEEKLHESIRVLQDVCHWPYRAASGTFPTSDSQAGGSPKFSYDQFQRVLKAVDTAARDFFNCQQEPENDGQQASGNRATG